MKNSTDQAKYSAYLTIDELELITSYRMLSYDAKEAMRMMCADMTKAESKGKAVNVVQLRN